jgi:FAD/FMN-containing dehydrogenase
MIKEAALDQLRATLAGPVLTPPDAGYDDARRVHNGMFARRPAVIARCLGTADVVETVRFARANGYELAVRGGGHSVAGKSVCEGGVVLDLSLMKGIFVDPVRRTARAQGGVTWREFNRETQLHGLATTGGVVSTTGIAGLTLGGGLGWLMGKHGLAADNLIAAEVVTAAGEVVRASAEENRDLFWGLRGGGGNFGVVVWFEYRLHPVGRVTSGLVAHPIERAREVLRFFRETTAEAPDELTLDAGLLHAPDGSGAPLAAIIGCHCGALPDGESAMRPIKRFASPMADTIGPATYVDTNTTIFDAGFPRGARNYWKSSFLAELSDPAIDALVARFALCPSPMSGLVLEHFHGAAARVGVRDTAFPHRRESCNLMVVAEWLDPADDEKNIAWARATYDALRPYMGPHMAGESYANYQTEDETVEQAYGPNHERLVALKNALDPTNLFHLNANVRPTVHATG